MEALAATLVDALVASLVQIAWLALALVVPVVLIASVEKATRAMLTSAFGWWSVMWSAWIGVPVHECSHVAACLVFGHRVTGFSLFAPDPRTGTLGWVDHSWETGDPWQRAGNLAVGIAPLVAATALMIAILHLVLPDGDIIWQGAVATSALLVSPTATSLGEFALHHVRDLPLALASREALGSFGFWIGIYLVAAVGQHASPSREDMKDTWPGILFVLGAILAANLAAAPFGGLPRGWILAGARLVVPASHALLIALAVDAAVLVLVLALTWVVRGIRRRAPGSRWR